MKRNMALVRAILEAVEATPDLQRPKIDAALGDYDPVAVDAHVALLVDANFLVVENRPIGTPRQATIRRLTWQGYEYLDGLRNPPIAGEVLEWRPPSASGEEVAAAFVKQLDRVRDRVLGPNATRAEALEHV
jgi:hypothetical protein